MLLPNRLSYVHSSIIGQSLHLFVQQDTDTKYGILDAGRSIQKNHFGWLLFSCDEEETKPHEKTRGCVINHTSRPGLYKYTHTNNLVVTTKIMKKNPFCQRGLYIVNGLSWQHIDIDNMCTTNVICSKERKKRRTNNNKFGRQEKEIRGENKRAHKCLLQLFIIIWWSAHITDAR